MCAAAHLGLHRAEAPLVLSLNLVHGVLHHRLLALFRLCLPCHELPLEHGHALLLTLELRLQVVHLSLEAALCVFGFRRPLLRVSHHAPQRVRLHTTCVLKPGCACAKLGVQVHVRCERWVFEMHEG